MADYDASRGPQKCVCAQLFVTIPVHFIACLRPYVPLSLSLTHTHNQLINQPQKKNRSTSYLLVTTIVSLAATACFTCFLPTQRAMCQQWKALGETASARQRDVRAALTLVVAVVIVAYGIVGSVLLLDKRTSCLKFIGGPGCK